MFNPQQVKNRTKLIVAGLGLVQLALLGKQAAAQDAKSLDEVVISTTKNNQKQSQTGKVVTIIDSTQLQRSSGRTVADLLNQQAGIQVLSTGSNLGKDKSVFFRGAASAYAVVLIDGVLAADPSATGASFDLRLLSVDQIERIEILRGGQSTLYGSDAVAGVINIITKKKAKTGNNVYGVASAGSYDTYKGTLGLSSKVDAFTYNINYTHLKTNGISESEAPAGNTQIYDRDGMKQDAVNANFSLQLDKRLVVNPFLRYVHATFDYDDGPFLDAANTSFTKNFNGGLNAVYQLDKGKFTLNYSYQSTSRDYKDAYPRQLEGRMNLLDFFYDQNLGHKVNLLLGVDNRATAVSYYEATGVSRPSTNLFSTYGSIFLHDLSIFNLEVGGRYNKHNKYGENYTYTITPSLVLTKQVKLFGTASSAFRAPTLDMLFGPWGANINLKPEKSNGYEAGLDLNFLTKKIKLRAVAFKRDITDAIFYGANGYINQDEQKDKGFEVEPRLLLGKLDLGGYYTYVEGKQTSGTVVSNVLLRRPKHIYGVNAGFKATENLYVSANYKFTGKRTDTEYGVWPAPNVDRVLASYKLLDFYAEYALAKKHLKVFADLKNITNEKYTEIIGYRTMGFNMNAGVSFNIR